MYEAVLYIYLRHMYCSTFMLRETCTHVYSIVVFLTVFHRFVCHQLLVYKLAMDCFLIAFDRCFL